MTYNFSATQNNGRIVSSADAVTGENVGYTYDALNRLIAAATSGTTGAQWGDSYSYDGFGNLTGKTVTKGSAPPLSPLVDSSTNRVRMSSSDNGYDANGNWLGSSGTQYNTWNVENQLVGNGELDYYGFAFTYTYDPWGKRVLQFAVDGGTLWFYGITGQRLASYRTSTYVTSSNPPTPQQTMMYFGGRMLAPMDRLGSVRNNAGTPIAYYPWGEERTATADGTDKFATYFRDTSVPAVGQDYAGARYYNNNLGRFWSPDPAGVKAVRPKNPTSWNRYAYANDDPVNRNDPSGRDPFDEGLPSGGCAYNTILGEEGFASWGMSDGGEDMCPDPSSGPPCNNPTNSSFMSTGDGDASCGGDGDWGDNTPGCSLQVAYSGSPYNQTFAGIADAPPNGQLGGYEVSSGWYNAVQLQGVIWGDTDPSHWAASQIGTETGTLWIQTWKGVIQRQVNVTNPPDFPDRVSISQGQFGTNFDWLDTPGQGRKTKWGTVVGASVTFSFTSDLKNTITGADCPISWSFNFSLSNPGDKWKMW